MSGPISKKRKANELSSSAVQPSKSKNEQTKTEKSNAPAASTAEIPPLEPLETLVAAYLQDRNLSKTLKAFEKETNKTFDAKSPSINLQTIWESYQKDNTTKNKPTNGVNDAAASIAAQIRSGMNKVAEKVAPKNDESDESEVSSEDESREEDESTSDESDDEEDEDSSEESDSEESSAESESDSASESEVDQRPTKKRVQQIKGKAKARPVQESESSSSSSSSSESDSDSDAEPTVNGVATNGIATNGVSDKMELDEDDTSSSSSSSSESESEAEPATIPVNGPSHTTTAVPNGTTPAQKRAPMEELSSPVEVKRQKKTNEPFSRIPKDQLVDPRFSSNKYNSYDYAERAHKDLIVTKGKGFTKEKNKKKKGSYRGGIIDIGGGKAVKFD